MCIRDRYCKDLIAKYYPYFPIWVFVELISFGDLLYFCYFCEKRYKVKIVNRTCLLYTSEAVLAVPLGLFQTGGIAFQIDSHKALVLGAVLVLSLIHI